MTRLFCFLILTIAFSCDPSTKESRSFIVQNTDLADTGTITLNIKSPSGRCNYDLVVNKNGIGYCTFIGSGGDSVKIVLHVTHEQDLKSLRKICDTLEKSSLYLGENWTDSWTYTVAVNQAKKIVICRIHQSTYVNQIIQIFEKYCKLKIDYTCF
ncbi:MAG: hypothetical protein RL660_1892 [Bacteroidota bacterium]|jgi:hypothetical protein